MPAGQLDQLNPLLSVTFIEFGFPIAHFFYHLLIDAGDGFWRQWTALGELLNLRITCCSRLGTVTGKCASRLMLPTFSTTRARS